MNILVACEESQRVCAAFRAKGHRAFSCDVVECSGGHPEWHIQSDVIPLLNGNCTFKTADAHTHTQSGRWDLIIAHPPCTYLSNAGACRLFKKFDGKSYIDLERYKEGLKAKTFFEMFYNANCEKIVIENPIPSKIYELPPYDQIIQPYEHGDPYSKKTCLWLKGVEPLKPTNIVEPICSWVSGGSKRNDGTSRINKGTKIRSSKERAKTFLGVAKAMAEQWGHIE